MRCQDSEKSTAYFWSSVAQLTQTKIMVRGSLFVLLISLLLSMKKREANGSETTKFDGKLKIDQAYINVTTHDTEDLFILVYGIDTDCWKCEPQLINNGGKPVNARQGFDVIVNKTSYKYKLVISKNTSDGSNHVICRKTHLYGERGWYEFIIHKKASKQKLIPSYKCKVITIKEPEKTYIPVLVAILILVGMAAAWILLTELSRRNLLPFCCRGTDGIINADLGTPKPMSSSELPSDQEEDMQSKKPKAKRLKSLDTFRGIAITIMVFVNYGGGGYYFFEHARWNGLHVADLVFPWFIWIMGVSMTLSFRSLRRRKVKKSKILKKIIRRSLILFGLGVFTSNYGDLERYRVPGVLQRFGISYFVVAVMQLLIPPQYEDPEIASCFYLQSRWLNYIRDVVGLWAQWLIVSLLLFVYIVITYLVPIPGCPTGYVGPGGIGQDYPKAEKCTGGMAGYIDRMFFGYNHIYQHPTPKKLYRTVVPHDPEGCLGSLTSIVLVFFGVQAGRILFTYRDHKARIIRWLLWGVFLGVIAIGLTGGTKNEGLVPINKNLWAVSFILATGATAFILLAACYVLIDVAGWWNGAPFFYAGMNAILVYVGHEILNRHFPFSWDMDKYTGTHAEKLAMNMLGTGLWLLIAYYLFTVNFFLKI